jgi:hypothetical protein
MVQDPSMVHETLAYELFRSVGVPAPRTGYAFVRVNGAAYGVYLNIETLDLVSLPRWFASTRHLYEGQVGLDVSPGAAPDFEVDEGKSKKREDLEALILAAAAEEGDWSDGMVAVADLAEMTRMWAAERYIGHWDGYAGADADLFRPNNYYLHSEDTGAGAGRFQMLPWGTDQTWGSRLEFDEPAGGLLFNRCVADGDCGALYEDALRAVQSSIAGQDPRRRVACIATLLAPWQALEDGERREYDAEEIEEGVAATVEFAEDRPAELADYLGTKTPFAGTGQGLCAGPEVPPAPGAVDPVAEPARGASPPGLEPTLRLGRVGVARGVLSARFSRPASGRVDLRAAIKTRRGLLPACAASAPTAGPGPVTVRCALSESVRRRLAVRWLRLRLEATFTPLAGLPSVLTGSHLAPRSGRADRRHPAP